MKANSQKQRCLALRYTPVDQKMLIFLKHFFAFQQHAAFATQKPRKSLYFHGKEYLAMNG